MPEIRFHFQEIAVDVEWHKRRIANKCVMCINPCNNYKGHFCKLRISANNLLCKLSDNKVYERRPNLFLLISMYLRYKTRPCIHKPTVGLFIDLFLFYQFKIETTVSIDQTRISHNNKQLSTMYDILNRRYYLQY